MLTINTHYNSLTDAIKWGLIFVLMVLGIAIISIAKSNIDLHLSESTTEIVPPKGLVENPNHIGSYGKHDGPNNRFREYWRLDKGEPGKPGWRGKDHVHHYGGKEHLATDTPFDPESPYPDTPSEEN